ncbi:MAG: hypothetical protein NVS9B11_11160 [Candidatus Dormibacteraceae bacterium]
MEALIFGSEANRGNCGKYGFFPGGSVVKLSSRAAWGGSVPSVATVPKLPNMKTEPTTKTDDGRNGCCADWGDLHGRLVLRPARAPDCRLLGPRRIECGFDALFFAADLDTGRVTAGSQIPGTRWL